MKISLYTLGVLALVSTSAAQAQMTVDLSKVNCNSDREAGDDNGIGDKHELEQMGLA